MKVLVSTTETQGEKEGDFCFVPEGELVMPGFACDSPACGCARSLVGVDTRKATTTFKVEERRSLSLGDHRRLLRESMEKAWGTVMDKKEIATYVWDWADEMAQVADPYPLGTVLEYNGTAYITRRQGGE